MKNYVSFLVKAVVIGVFVSQTTVADTGYQVMGLSIAEPIYLSLCGLALLYLGIYSKTNGDSDLV